MRSNHAISAPLLELPLTLSSWYYGKLPVHRPNKETQVDVKPSAKIPSNAVGAGAIDNFN